MNKIDSTFINLLSGEMSAGKTSTHTIISKIDDPDAFGSERIQLNGVVFDELTLADWELKKLQEESIAFTFTSWKILDTTDPE